MLFCSFRPRLQPLAGADIDALTAFDDPRVPATDLISAKEIHMREIRNVD